jgi:hypothetical protein
MPAGARPSGRLRPTIRNEALPYCGRREIAERLSAAAFDDRACTGRLERSKMRFADTEGTGQLMASARERFSVRRLKRYPSKREEFADQNGPPKLRECAHHAHQRSSPAAMSMARSPIGSVKHGHRGLLLGRSFRRPEHRVDFSKSGPWFGHPSTRFGQQRCRLLPCVNGAGSRRSPQPLCGIFVSESVGRLGRPRTCAAMSGALGKASETAW